MIRIPLKKKLKESESLDMVPGRALPKGKTWKAHQGIKSRTRNLKRLCQPVLQSKDPEIAELLLELDTIVSKKPNPELAKFYIISQAIKLATDGNAPVAEMFRLSIATLEE